MNITMKKIAELAGVTRPAVSVVLNGKKSSIRVSPDKREKILQIAKKYDFIPNQAAIQLQGCSTSHLIGLITVPGTRGIVSALQSEVINALHDCGFEILASQYIHTMETQDCNTIINKFRSRRVDGIISLAHYDYFRKKAFECSLPFVDVGSFYLKDNQTDVGYDTQLGGYLAAKYLCEYGKKRIFYVTSEKPNNTGSGSRFKFRGIKKALKEFSLPSDDAYFYTDNMDANFVIEKLIEQHADAVICTNDFFAQEFLRTAYSMNIRIPEDIAVVGFDGYRFCNFGPVTLATVMQPLKGQAQRAVSLLIERIETPSSMSMDFAKIFLEPTFRPAESCGCKVKCKKNITGNENLFLENF